MDLFSFDIFDTCLVRACGCPENIFYILAQTILGKNVEEMILRDFVRERRKAENMAKHLLNKEAVTIDELYHYFDTIVYTDIDKEIIKNKEIEIERQLLVPVKTIRDKIERCRTKGKIAFISDMYLPDEMLKDVLRKNSLLKDGDTIYISGSVGCSKLSGNLFKYVREKENVKYSSWTHYGDNFKSDYIIPRKLGIRVKKISHDYSKMEKKWIRDSIYIENKWILKSFSGMVRSIRLKNGIQKDNFIANVMLPAFVPFVFGILQKAREDKIDRLYFASRDTYLFYLMAKSISHLFPEIELNYLYISTKVLYPVGFANGKRSDIKFILNHLEIFKPRLILKMIGFSEDEQNNFQKYLNIDADLVASKSDLFVDLLLNEEYKPLLLKYSACKVDKLMQYLKQIKFIGEGNVALLDLGWNGTSQYMLSKLLNNIHFYYYGINKGILPIKEIGKYDAFFAVEDYERLSIRIIEFYMCKMLEGSTLDYELENGLAKPILEDTFFTEQDEIDFEYKKTIMIEAVELYSKNPLLFNYSKQLFTLISVVTLQYISQNPPYSYVKFLSNKMMWDRFSDKKRIIKRMSPYKLLNILYHSYSQSHKYSGLWIEGCIVYSLGGIGRWLLRMDCISKLKAIGKKIL